MNTSFVFISAKSSHIKGSLAHNTQMANQGPMDMKNTAVKLETDRIAKQQDLERKMVERTK